jgi:hypothetical protein
MIAGGLGLIFLKRGSSRRDQSLLAAAQEERARMDSAKRKLRKTR